MEDKPLKDFAAEYIKQIRAADDETAIMILREFGEKAYRRGWRSALKRFSEIATYLELEW